MKSEIVAAGLRFAECPRWHEGRLWFSDMHDSLVMAFDPEGGPVEGVLRVPGKPGGLGWLPDGVLRVVSMTDRKLLEWTTTDELSVVADLSSYTPYLLNDMVLTQDGTAFVGGFGFDAFGGAPRQDTRLLMVDAKGGHQSVGTPLSFPNGMVISADGRTLIVAESHAHRLTAFDIEPTGELTAARVWADLGSLRATPDGICMDNEGCVWVASPRGRECLRVSAGGTIEERVSTGDRMCIAPVLGGDDGRTLFLCTAQELIPERCLTTRTSCIEAVRVDVPGNV